MKQAFSDEDVSQSPYQTWETFKALAHPAYVRFIEQCVLADCEYMAR